MRTVSESAYICAICVIFWGCRLSCCILMMSVLVLRVTFTENLLVVKISSRWHLSIFVLGTTSIFDTWEWFVGYATGRCSIWQYSFVFCRYVFALLITLSNANVVFCYCIWVDNYFIQLQLDSLLYSTLVAVAVRWHFEQRISHSMWSSPYWDWCVTFTVSGIISHDWCVHFMECVNVFTIFVLFSSYRFFFHFDMDILPYDCQAN